MNYAYARVSAKDRTYSCRLPRLVSNGAELRYAPRDVHPVHDVIMTGVQSLRFRQKSGTDLCRFFGGAYVT